MKNSMRELTQEEKDKDPGAYRAIYGGSGTQVYLNDEQVFDVSAAGTFSTRDKAYSESHGYHWIDYIKFKDGTFKTGKIRIICNGDDSDNDWSMSVVVDEGPMPLLWNQ
jgi:hypothetical protein